ncbi:hypothetical protein [Shewanella sp. S23-S33]|uniref:hypothetical protein n=1 Tax=Shewanella sp. S23-S33 TaxID=3342769 RepID=UPI00372D1C94
MLEHHSVVGLAVSADEVVAREVDVALVSLAVEAVLEVEVALAIIAEVAPVNLAEVLLVSADEVVAREVGVALVNLAVAAVLAVEVVLARLAVAVAIIVEVAPVNLVEVADAVQAPVPAVVLA